MPTTIASIRSHPCANGLLPRPKRLFGFDGTAGEDTHSLAGSPAHRFFGLSPATAPSPISGRRDGKLQGVSHPGMNLSPRELVCSGRLIALPGAFSQSAAP